ncbi:hypothetical protein SCOR_15890 [Sulfidibacter corallicola]|uniref:Uncharacterized protein n=1 Tax=Sulfidibacter corallicola TaxID=2818388 RepID=A0A8A4TYM8_SULCO|nr:hypothetical protein [Sulfidibacter corallicola]QTD54052.1 hypothetical protein J3U87_16525 [Sulfidibacter corallicola]
MSAYFIELDQNDPGFDPFVNGKYLAREAEALNDIANSLGVNTLDDWLSEEVEDYLEDVAEMNDLDDDDDDEEFGEDQSDEGEEKKGTWFEAEEGINWLQTLVGHLEEHEDELNNQQQVTDELNEYLEVLEQAEAVGARWRLALDI